MIEAGGLYGDIVDDMRRSSDRILADLEHQIEFHGTDALQALPPRKRADLFVFFQECLINIIRHSGATRAHTRLSVADGVLGLVVSDNGRGLGGGLPSSLRRRARLLGADVEAGPSEWNGARIHLRLKIRRTESSP
jgi:signal transduction histidine kinase